MILLLRSLTGLDAAVTYDIVASIRAWANAMSGTVVIALLQVSSCACMSME